MAKGYVVANIRVTDQDKFQQFSGMAGPAIKKYGGISSEALRKAAAETNIPVGGTLMGYGVKFQPKSSDMAGQNNDAFPVVVQYTGGEAKIAWPKELQTTDPVLSLPKSSPYSK